MTTHLAELNQFVCHSNNVYGASTDVPGFNYSDGVSTEQQLQKILSQATDLSSTSVELQAQIHDWPTEYHLSPVRANLLRGFDFTGIQRVLELGCGCGAITRYLGELGLDVDAVEGSPVRAELAASRCRDLDNVNIHTGNFNELNFPKKDYDLVLYVGVTEYAGRFSEKNTDQEALQDLLALAKQAMSNRGVLFIAIENRTGLKYLLGANEDHYALPYVGIDNYPQGTGIRTYTIHEWDEQLNKAGFSKHEYVLPFPDYKMPEVLLHQNFVKGNPQAYLPLEHVRTRDYSAPSFSQGAYESIHWQTLAQADVLAELSNSLVIVASQQKASVNAFTSFDYSQCPDFSYKLPFCVHTLKPKGQPQLIRQSLLAGTELKMTNFQAEQQSKLAGVATLSSHWLRNLTNEAGDESFKQQLSTYFLYLKQQDELSVDFLPTNLTAQDSQIIFKHWQTVKTLMPEQIFIRALCEFYQMHGNVVAKLATQQRWNSGNDYFTYAFQAIGQEISNEQLSNWLQKNHQINEQLFVHPEKPLFEEAVNNSEIGDQFNRNNESELFALKEKITALETENNALLNSKGWRLLNKCRKVMSLFQHP